MNKKEEKECALLTNSKGYAQFPPGYGIFPYIILKGRTNKQQGQTCFHQ